MSEYHSPLSPSKAHRWYKCAASIAKCRSCVEKPSEYAEEGTLAHAVASHLLLARVNLSETEYEKCLNYIKTGEQLIEEHVISEDMAAYAATYVEIAYKLIDPDATVYSVEKEVDLSNVLGIPGERGKPDCAIVDSDANLYVIDFKYGMNKVHAENNEQLILYALGVLLNHDLSINIRQAHLPILPILQIHLIIIQPRRNHVSEVVLTKDELLSWKPKFQQKAKIAWDLYLEKEKIESKHYSPGEIQCKFCPAKAECPALELFVKKQIISDFDGDDDTFNKSIQEQTESVNRDNVGDIKATNIGSKLSQLSLIRLWCTAVEDYARTLLLNGEPVPGWKLILGRKPAGKWTDPSFTSTYVSNARLGKILTTKKLVTPADAKKLLADRPNAWKKIERQIYYAQPKPSMVPESKKGVPWEGDTADDFKDDNVKADDNSRYLNLF